MLLLLEIVYLSRKIAVSHCKGHQVDISEVSLGNQKTNFSSQDLKDSPSDDDPDCSP